MAESGEKPEDHQKTEEPTEHRIQEALREGQWPLSRELNGWAVLCGFSLLMVWGFFPVLSSFKAFFENIIHHASFLNGDEVSIVDVIAQVDLYKNFLKILLGCLALPALCALGMGLIQTKGRWHLKALIPKGNRLSWGQGVQRIFSLNALVEFFKTLLKALCVLGICVAIIKHKTHLYAAMIMMPGEAMLHALHNHMTTLWIGSTLLIGVLAVLDRLYRQFQWRKNLRMTPQQVRDEQKMIEGNPQIKGRQRSIHQAHMKKMLEAIPQATIVVTNPTHYAVALHYDPLKHDAPKLIAKGLDDMALAIREKAREHHVPVLRKPDLARALYHDVPLNKLIPAKHYEAVAKLIQWVLSLKTPSFPS